MGEGGVSAKPVEYREWRVKNGKKVNWGFVRRCLRYRQEARDLLAAGFQECRSWTALPFEDQMGWKRISDVRIANDGKSLWVRVTDKFSGT
jgi:hypothetical protein